MWPFIFILAMVPMVYYWSDSVIEVFPVLAQYLPAKGDKPAKGAPGSNPLAVKHGPGTPTKWAEANSEGGYVAWLVAQDGQYRIAVGCQQGAPAGLQLTHASGKPVPEQLMVDYQAGQLPFSQGLYSGTELLGAVSQFGAITVSVPPSAQAAAAGLPATTVAQFLVDRRESGLIARKLQQTCQF